MFMAPDILLESILYSHKVDVWALGIIFFTLLTGIPIIESENLS